MATKLPSAIRLAGCRDQRLNLEVELHFVIVRDGRRDLQVTAGDWRFSDPEFKASKHTLLSGFDSWYLLIRSCIYNSTA